MYRYAVFSGGRTALLLTPGTGVCKPACGKQAARYRQMAAAVDEAAQTDPTVSPFDPAVREMRLLCCASGVANTGQWLWSSARAFDVIVLMEQRCNLTSSFTFVPQAVLASMTMPQQRHAYILTMSRSLSCCLPRYKGVCVKERNRRECC